MKLGELGKLYSIGTQGIFSLVAFTGVGFLIGYNIDKNSAWPAICAIIGAIIGTICFVSYLLYFIKLLDERKKRKKKEETNNENDKRNVN
jgi:F0F1-type ATP synthase assembly protein I